MAQASAPGCLGHQHAADYHVTAMQLRVQQAQVSHQLVVLPGHQVVGVALQILIVDVLVDAFLLDDKYICPQTQNGVELFLAQIIVVLANPIDSHRSISHKDLAWIVMPWPATVLGGGHKHL